MDRSTYFTFVLSLIITTVVLCSGQTSNSDEDVEKGVILTVESTNGNTVHLRHLGVNLPYDNITGSISVPGIRFSDPNILFLSVEVDYREKELFLYDVHLKSIFLGTSYHPKLRVSENNMSFYILHAGVSTGAVQIAYDWLSRTIYWVDSVFKWIVAAPGSFEKLEFDYFKIIVKDGLQHPEGLTVDPIAGYMFFSDNGDPPKIERALLDGSEIMKFDLTKDALISPESLEVDIFEKRLYIADTGAERIVSVDYDGKNFHQVRRLASSIFTDVAIYRDTLYAPNIRNGRLYIFNKTDGSAVTGPIGITNERVYGVAIYKEEVQPLNPNATTNCTALACDHFCVSTATGAKCICSEGFALNTTSDKCYEVEGKFHRAIVLASATDICLLDIRALSAFSIANNLTCIYTVREITTTTSTTTTTTTPTPTTQKSTATLVQSSTPNPTATLVHSSAHTTHITHSPVTTSKTTVPTASPQTAGATTRMTTAAPARRKRQVMQNTTVAGSTATTTPFSLAPKETILRLELDMVERFLFFATFDHEKNFSMIHTRPIDIPISNTERETLVTPSGIVSGLVFDWVDEENLYWSESDTGNIYVFNTKTQSSRIVMAGPVNSPSDLNILAYERKLVWISMNTANNYSIHTVDLNGQNLRNVVVNRAVITSIAVDQDAKLIYWTENGAAYRIHFNGTDQQPEFVNATNSPDADLLVLYKNYLAWTRPENGGTVLEAYVIDRGTEGNNGVLDPSTSFVDMKILDAQSQSPVTTNPCADQNGNCEQICITTRLENGNMAKQCECSLGFVLQSDGLNCGTEYVDDEFALVTDWTNDNIFQIDLKTDKINALHFEEQTTYFGVFYNKLTQKVLWSELNSPLVFQSNIDGENKSEIFDNGNGQVEKYAVDETTGNIFYTVNVYPTSAKIGVLSPRGEHRYLSLDISFQPTYFFSGIDVHPKKGLLYVTAGSYFFRSYIVKANMDGSNAQQLNIPIQDDFSLPEGVAVDHVNDKLYWADYYQDKIYQCDLDGNNCVLFVSQPAEDIKDIATDGEFLYYTAWNSHHLNRVNLMDTSDVREVGSTLALGRLETVSVYRSSAPNTQQPNTDCQKRDGRGRCSVFCLPTELSYACACEEGDTLGTDGRTCPGVFLCDQKFNQTNTTNPGEIVTVTINDTCLRYVDEVCSFKCPSTYKMKEGQGPLLCTSTGWDTQTDELCEPIYCPTSLANGQWSNCDERAGSTCQYVCNQGYRRRIKSSVTCGVDGQWSDDTDTLCSSEICIQSITFGQIDSGCPKSNGSVCIYTCNGGYRPTQNAPTSLTCNIDGNWSTDPTSLCEETLCPSTIINGNISSTCTNKIGAVCTYSCVAGSFKPAGLTSLRCLANGNWDSNGQTPCSAICTTSEFKCDTTHECINLSKVCDRTNDCADGSDENPANCSCPRTIDNGSIRSNCDFRFDSTCSYTCDIGYRATLSVLTCQRSTKNWNSSAPCEEIFCPATIPNGNISSTCNRKVNSSCVYNCTESFQKYPSITSLVCQVAGTWNQTAGLCISQQTVTEGQTSKSAGSSVGIALGVLIAVLVIIALVLVFVMYRRRLGFFKKESPYSTASFSNSSRENVSIENPGYMTADLRVTNDMDEPYINTAMKEEPFSGIPQPVVDHNDIDAGIANPLYFNQEPLASGGEISEQDGDNLVLTTDSWLKEKEKGPDISSNNNQ